MNLKNDKLWSQMRQAYEAPAPGLDTASIMAAVRREAAAHPRRAENPGLAGGVPVWVCALAASLALLAAGSVIGRSIRVADRQIDQADLILVMENSQKRLVLDRFPKADGRVRLLKSYSENYSDADPDIQDPYRMSIYHYRVCFSEIYLSVQGLLESLSKRGQR